MIYVLSGTNAYAFITVTYPAGSTLTCTSGSTTLNAKTTAGSYVFCVPQAGTWTVKATSGTNTASKSVSITSRWQSESVVLSYATFLFDNGAVVPFSKQVSTNSTVSIGDTILFGGSGEGYDRGAVAYTTSKIDLTEYNSVVFEGAFTHVINSNAARSMVGVTTQTPHPNNGMDKLFAASAYLDVQNKSWSVDISSLTGTYYVCASAGDGSNENLIGNITKIYLL